MPYRRSLSARRAWIEIFESPICEVLLDVALRKESVDRNKDAGGTESVYNVALRKESVDRNVYCDTDSVKYLGSLSARRAWIEMLGPSNTIPWRQGRSPQGERG